MMCSSYLNIFVFTYKAVNGNWQIKYNLNFPSQTFKTGICRFIILILYSDATVSFYFAIKQMLMHRKS